MPEAVIAAENRTKVRHGQAPIARLTKPSREAKSVRDFDLEDIMRIALLAMLVVAAVLTATTPSHACPPGYAACGTRYCCPR